MAPKGGGRLARGEAASSCGGGGGRPCLYANIKLPTPVLGARVFRPFRKWQYESQNWDSIRVKQAEADPISSTSSPYFKMTMKFNLQSRSCIMKIFKSSL